MTHHLPRTALAALLAAACAAPADAPPPVEPPPPADRPPVISAVDASRTSVGPGEAVALSSAAQDPDGDPLAFAWSAACSGAASGAFADAGSASTQWTAAPTSGAGTCTLALDVTANGKTARRTVDVAVVPPASPTLVDALRTLAARKTYFAHNSVGGQITGAIVSLAQASSVSLTRMYSPSFATPMLGETAVGQNYDPMSKIADFENARVPAYGSKAQYAMFKFCYVDFTYAYQATPIPVADIFGSYKAAMARLRAAYPGVTFVHITAPLCPPTTTQAFGIRRHEYNELLRAEYAGKEPLFDLARHEATAPDGTRVTFVANGTTYDALAPEYLGTECHLNADGANRMAEALVLFLATLP